MKFLKAEQAGAFFSSESAEKKRTGRVGLSVTLIGKRVVNSRNANPNGQVGQSVTSIGKRVINNRKPTPPHG